MLCFELSMPSAGSWDDKWSGAGKPYAKLVPARSRKRADDLLERRSWSHRWPDGWCACITVREVDSAEARKIRRLSNGFCGYDWMVEQIIRTGEIKPGFDGCKTY